MMPVICQQAPMTFAGRAAITTQYGVPVMPVLARSKQAFLDDWQTLATTDTKQIAEWQEKNPDFNCAAVARKGGFWILDVDSPDLCERIVKETSHSLDELDTLVVKSSGAKRHFYFKHDSRSESMGYVEASDKGKELFSARIHNMYVVGPGSIHPNTGQPYEVIKDPTFCEIPVAPEWLIDWILKFKSKSPAVQTSPTSDCEIIGEGGRDNYLFEQACKLRDIRLSKTDVLSTLQELNRRHCNPAMPDRVVEQKVESAFSREPRGGAEPVPFDIHEIKTPDMPDSVLTGRLGEIYDKYMRTGFPVGWAWLSLVTVAGTLVPMPEYIRTNLFSGLVGDVHTGKSQCILWTTSLLGLMPPILQKVMAGSSEGLLARLQSADGEPRLLSPDELGHLLSKSKIDNASFPYVLNSAYYETQFELTVARGKQIGFNCNLSLIGGIVTDMFDSLFGAETVGGLYDRFCLAQCPTGFQYDYRPCPRIPVLATEPVRVCVAPDVWEMKLEWTQNLKMNPRVVESGLRVAAICAAVDGRALLRAADLAPVLPFVQYQESLRKILKPNPGENADAKLAHKFIDYINRNGSNGEWLDVREMLRRTHAYDLSAGWERVINALEHSGEIEKSFQWDVRGHKKLVRLDVPAAITEAL